MPKGTVHGFDQLNAKARALAAMSKNPFARDSPKMLQYFFELESRVPVTYLWKFTPTEALVSRLSTVIADEEWNDIYWRDIAENIQAFSVLTHKRATAILKPAIRALNTENYLAAAVLARSALELSAWALFHTTSFRSTIANIPEHLSERSTRFTADGLQAQLVKVLWGTRLQTDNQELKQTNVLSVIEKLDKRDPSKFLKPTYEYLCEATHPNVIGNAEFWEYPESPSATAPFTVRIGSSRTNSTPNELLECTFGALGWSGASVRNAMLEARTAVQWIGERFAISR